MPIAVCRASQIIADSSQLPLGHFIREFYLSGNWFCPGRGGCVLKSCLCFWVLKVTDTTKGGGRQLDAAAPGCSAYMSMLISGCAPTWSTETHVHSYTFAQHCPWQALFILLLAQWPFHGDKLAFTKLRNLPSYQNSAASFSEIENSLSAPWTIFGRMQRETLREGREKNCIVAEVFPEKKKKKLHKIFWNRLDLYPLTSPLQNAPTSLTVPVQG